MEDRPQWSALASQIADLRRVAGTLQERQRRMLRVTGTAWSPDRYVKAVVGPRGQLVELEIDPRIYRSPNSRELAATIVATVRAATDQAIARTREILDEDLPADLHVGATGRQELYRLATSHDADLLTEADDAQLR
jgi:DNA-binding protein YbaB